MGAFPSQNTSKSVARVLDADSLQCSPNLLLAKKLINRPQADRRRRAIHLDILEEGESLFEKESSSLVSDVTCKSSFGELTSPCFSAPLDSLPPDKCTPGLIPTNTVSLQTDPVSCSLVSATTQTEPSIVESHSHVKSESDLTESDILVPSLNSGETHGNTDQLDFHSKAPSITYQDSSFQTEFVPDFENYQNTSIFIQTDISENHLQQTTYDEVELSLKWQDFSMQTEPLLVLGSQPDTRTPGINIHVQTDDVINESFNQLIEVTSHDMAIQVITDDLEPNYPVLNDSAYIQTDNVVISPPSPTNHKEITSQFNDTAIIDECCSPDNIQNKDSIIKCESYLNVETQTINVTSPTLSTTEKLDVGVQTDVEQMMPLNTPLIINSKHALVQTDLSDIISTDTPVHTSLSTIETQTDTDVVDVCIQTVLDYEFNNSECVYVQTLEFKDGNLGKNTNSKNQLEDVYVQTDILIQEASLVSVNRQLTSTQSQTETEIILEEANSAPIERGNSQLNVMINSSVQTEGIQDYILCVQSSSQDEISDQTVIQNANSKDMKCTYCRFPVANCMCPIRSLDHNTYYESTSFNMSDRLCEFKAKNEQLIEALVAKENELEDLYRSKKTVTEQQNSLKEIIELILKGVESECEINVYFPSLQQLIEDIRSPEMGALLKSLFDKIRSLSEDRPLQTIEKISSTEQTSPNFEGIRSMVSKWSEEELEQLPHYLTSVQAEIQNLNAAISTKDLHISELKFELDNIKNELKKRPVDSNAQFLPSAATPNDEVRELLEELAHLKNNLEQLEIHLCKSETKNKEYASLLQDLQEDSNKIETKDAFTATDKVSTTLSVEEVSQFESQLEFISILMKHLVQVRGRVVGSIPSHFFPSYVKYSDIGCYLDQVSQLLKIYANDLELLEAEMGSSSQVKLMFNETQTQLQTEKIAHQKTQANLSSAQEQLTDLFESNDRFELQLKLMKQEAEKQTIDLNKEKYSLMKELQDNNKVFEQNEQLCRELDSVQTLYSDSVSRNKVEEIVNQVVKFERDNSSLQREVENLRATRSHLESHVLHLKTQIEADRFDYKQELGKEQERGSSQVLELEEVLGHHVSEIGNLKEKLEAQTVILTELEKEAAEFTEKVKDVDKLRRYVRIKDDHISLLENVQIPMMDDEMIEIEKERDSLKESLAALEAKYKETTVLLSTFQNVDESSVSGDKVSMTHLRAKCNSYERKLANEIRKNDILEEKCRNIERRRQIEVSEMPKHDFLSLRADIASLKSQARTRNQNLPTNQDTQLYPNVEDTQQPVRKKPDTDDNTNDCNPQ